MTTEDLILLELRSINANLTALLSQEPRMAQIPEASRMLGISQNVLRRLCRESKIKAGPITGSNNRRYVIDIPEARHTLLTGQHLIRRKSTNKTKSI